MNVSRRSFIRASSLAGLAAAFSTALPRFAFGQQRKGPAVFSLPKEVLSDPLYNLSRANFYSNIGSTFTFSSPSAGNVSLRLIEVADLKPLYGKGRPAGKECFSLLFQGAANRPLSQGTYSIRQSKLGLFKLFIVPTDEPTPLGPTYEANINRLYP